jgi:hypothetical protein
MGDVIGHTRDSPFSSPAPGIAPKNASPAPLPSNVVFIDDIPLDLEVMNQFQQRPQQQLQQQLQQQQQQQQPHGAGGVSPHVTEGKKAKCFSARCSIM